jgi:signal transduction histidine kinase
MGIGLAIGNLLLLPFNLWFTFTLSSVGEIPELQVQIVRAAHSYSASLAVLFLAYSWIFRARNHPTRLDYLGVSLASASMILVGATIAAANQLSHGSMVIFAFASFIATVVIFERPYKFVLWVISGAALVLASSFLLQQEGNVAASVQLNTLVIAVAVSIIYPIYDRFRFSDYQRRQQLERLIEMKNTLVRAMGHDLRTPLIEIRRVARLMEDAPSNLEDYRKSLANDLDAITHRFGMVLNNLMLLDAQITDQSGTQSPCALSEVIESVLELHQRDAERKSITLESALEEDVLVSVNRETLITVFDNLLSNAVKFSPEGGVVTLSTELQPEHVTIAVSDDGPGVAPVILRRLHHGEPLLPASGTAGERGVGIGLGVVISLLKSFGVELDFQPRTPRGTTARFTIPRYRRSTQA